jgi:hypothetical protein
MSWPLRATRCWRTVNAFGARGTTASPRRSCPAERSSRKGPNEQVDIPQRRVPPVQEVQEVNLVNLLNLVNPVRLP